MHTIKLTGITMILLGMLGMAALGACGGQNDQEQPQSQAGGASDGTTVGTRVGEVAPEFRLTTLQGAALQLADLRGKAVLLDFWDTWCPPCRRAMPHLQELSTQYSGRLVVVGIALGQEGEAKVRAFVGERGLTFPVAVGGEAIFSAFGVQNLPTTLLLDGDGAIRKKWVGGYEKSDYEAAVKAVIAD